MAGTWRVWCCSSCVADNDDEDANTEQDTEEDPDDADEDDILEARDSPQEQREQEQHLRLPPPQHLRPIQAQSQPRADRTFDRALKSANSNINFRPNEWKLEPENLFIFSKGQVILYARPILI